jgi:polyphosphate kinase
MTRVRRPHPWTAAVLSVETTETRPSSSARPVRYGHRMPPAEPEWNRPALGRAEVEPQRLDKRGYEKELSRLQVELVRLQDWVVHKRLKVVVLFEGRDTAGKGGTIKRITEKTNPRVVRTVALGTPTERERTQWYFQRYVAHLPAAGEIVLFDRSWYNRAVVEPVLGYATEEQYREFIREVPEFEAMLVRSGIHLVKFWFSVSRREQLTRFVVRQIDPVRQWKLSPSDLASLDRWDEYTEAKEAMFAATDTPHAPWTVVKSNDKKRARLEALRVVLSRIAYEGRDEDVVGVPDPNLVVPAAAVHEADRLGFDPSSFMQST